MSWEADWLLYIQEHFRSDMLNPVMTFITHTADRGVLLIIIVLALVLIPKTRRIGMIASISIILESVITNLIIKNAVARTRPYEVIDGLVCLVGKQPDYSFPSGHSGAGFAVAGALFVIALIGLPSIVKAGEITRSKTSLVYKIFTVIMLVYAAVLAFSRLYVGVHYPTDVIGGIVLGLGTSVLSYFVFHFAIKKYSERKEKTKV